MNPKLIKLFSKNRAEEFPVDVWGQYVLPPQYETINLFNFDKAVMIEGGRGSGKTMFLRYHCHDTRFSEKRSNIPLEELRKIGMYFRPDTHFCSSITEEIYGSDWKKVFGKYILVNVIREISRVTLNLSKCKFSSNFEKQEIIPNLELPNTFSKRTNSSISYYKELESFADTALEELNDWVNDPESYSRPIFPDTRSVISSLLKHLKNSFPELSETMFTVYIDEYENLTSNQQKLLNTWIKHGAGDLVISAAYKKYSDINRTTEGQESIVLRNDYRKVDLEKFEQEEFYRFAAEILILKLHDSIEDSDLFNYKDWLCNERLLSERLDDSYIEKVITFAKGFLPTSSYENVASTILEDETLKRRLLNFLINPRVSILKIAKEEFIDSKFPVESILNGILLNRKNQSPTKILKEFSKLKKDGTNIYYKPYRDLLVGAILWVYSSAGRSSIPIYSGFERICNMSRFNLRHFLEFCHQCLVEHSRSIFKVDSGFFIPIHVQASAARKNSQLEVDKVVELGRHGNNLRFIVNRLGLFFQLLQKRKSQSEPEVTHFGIEVASEEQLPENLRVLLNELKVWSVLVEFQGDTKRKSNIKMSSKEYMLHPMFSPNFSISFRKIRKHTFSVEQLNTIFCGSEEDFVEFCSPFAKKALEDEAASFTSLKEIQGSLFNDI
ncbi:ORC-CDC6 family AAA ATPase [Bowmanella dokdonensis]|uniref:Uncharacterized protein n=1 Tax=Bowmanella dokdonensis TaxID=751969 RepID=A0A939DMZ9_9ALTE|nr:hypothetical protein [Bowmanella dokdonensis]MBN7825100.1 hypothetical protein [Bowmanella dokdonensis]